MKEVLKEMQMIIIQAEKIYLKGTDKKAFVIATINNLLTEEQKKTFGPIIDALVDQFVILMKSDRMIAIQKKYCCF
jgi:hypothetical protein